MRLRFIVPIVSLCLILWALALGSALHSSDYNPSPVALGDDFEQAIRQSEAHQNVVPGAEKAFDWRFPDRRKTPYAFVQLHGFSASRREISPVGEILAQRFGANLFMTRLCGHGLLSHGMESVTADCLLGDAEEAYAIGHKMGEKVILLGTSTGAALALYLARRDPQGVGGLVLASPNFRPLRPESVMLKGPVGRWVSENLVKTHSWKPTSDLEERYWTTSYPMTAVAEMMNMLSWINKFDLSQIKVPMIVFYTGMDEAVSVDHILAKFAEYGGSKKIFEVPNAPHVLAGDIKSPGTTDFVVQKAEEFLKTQLLPQP